MDLLNLEENKRQKIEELKEEKDRILGAKSADTLRQEVSFLQAILTLMRDKTPSGKVKQTIEKNLAVIAGFWMHDKTRADVARWVQTLISELAEQQ